MEMAASSSTKQAQRRKKKSVFNVALVFLLICCFITLSVTLLHGSMVHNLSPSTHVLDSLLLLDSSNNDNNGNINVDTNSNNINVDEEIAPLAGLDCTAYGGPSNEKATEMVYWSDIPSDNEHVSPFYSPDKYMTFEPDAGGWNNIRMSMETVLGMAHAMGRTLVLPPEQRMYLLKGNAQQREFSFQDFYPMEAIAQEHKGLNVITMQDFLENVALKGLLKDTKGNVVFPPGNRTNWNGASSSELKTQLNPWFHSIAIMPEAWNPNKCLAAFPSSQNASHLEVLEELNLFLESETFPKEHHEQYVGHPVAIDASPKDRLLENLAGRTRLCLYDPPLQKAPLLHFHGNAKMGGRLLVHFYAFLYFESWKQDTWMKRFIRDHVRYVDEMQCAAARIVQAVRERSDKNGNKGMYDSFHIRRGDFQYKATRISAQEIYDISKDKIPEGSTVYIGTDERDKTFFDDMRKHWDIVFLDDYLDLVKGLNPSTYGMLDQLVTSRGRVFFGCWFSTFSSYVNRLRGYHSQKNKLPGHESGIIDSYYYALPDRKLAMREFFPVKQAFHAREFPRSWMNIDAGVDMTELQNAN